MATDLTFDTRSLWGFLLVLVRLGSVIVFVPMPGTKFAAVPARALLILALCAALQPLWPRLDLGSEGGVRLMLLLGTEMCFGLGVGILLSYAAESLVFSAQAMALQAGFSYASAIDPASQADSTVLQIIAQLAGNLFFFTCGMDSIALRAFARSLERVPPGSLAPGHYASHEIIRMAGSMLELGLRLALPVIGLLLLTDITLALAARLQAQLQLLSMSFPLKMLGTLVVLAATAPLAAWVYKTMAGRAAGAIEALLR